MTRARPLNLACSGQRGLPAVGHKKKTQTTPLPLQSDELVKHLNRHPAPHFDQMLAVGLGLPPVPGPVGVPHFSVGVYEVHPTALMTQDPDPCGFQNQR